ncbi:hypothetical protein M011DRAFT_470589 [Sporormia fimetaria CBS 119925]|uniref:Uncharacterized protein n=1 Tax=Sporormia fimetaria CBS 119925 TaxID=1340428 RepID=A0A6A6V347_9PLEO|nr:hypothetical protein M011DRAFT_470589 [Sporormia fimetaria CBS 119925]
MAVNIQKAPIASVTDTNYGPWNTVTCIIAIAFSVISAVARIAVGKWRASFGFG